MLYLNHIYAVYTRRLRSVYVIIMQCLRDIYAVFTWFLRSFNQRQLEFDYFSV